MEQTIHDSVSLLRRLIAVPRVSRNERAAADVFAAALADFGLAPQRVGNNVWCVSEGFDAARPTVLLNAHLDTVPPCATWTREPNTPVQEGDRLYGIGSNDCGGGLVALLAAYRLLRTASLPYNLVYLASAEEEVSGEHGMRQMVPLLAERYGLSAANTVAVVGEPTALQPATAERGLMVVDATAHGRAGHAARAEGINAIYRALDDIDFIRHYEFRRPSPLLGPTRMQATVIEGGTRHNVVPDTCHFVIDVRTNEQYTNEEVFAFLQAHLGSELQARSFRLHSSRIDADHWIVRRCVEHGLVPFGSPTLSDQALMPWPSLKLGPGQSARSHSADEYITLTEISDAVALYLQLLGAGF